MAANSYYDSHPLNHHHHDHHQQEQQLHLLSHAQAPHGFIPQEHSSPLKPLCLVNNMDAKQQPHHFEDFEQIKNTQVEDEHLKARIRRLRLISRIVGFAISIAVFIPITLTLHKFLTTRNIYHDVTLPNGTTQSRTAWAKESVVWPTWMYFLVASIAVLLNFIILISYFTTGVKGANRAAYITTAFTWAVMVSNLVVWCVAVSMYRAEKKTTDLWGWTCSSAARAIQKEFAKEVDFDRFCGVQSVSWYIGLVQVAAAVLTIVIYVLVLRRRKTKKRLSRRVRMVPGLEAAR